MTYPFIETYCRKMPIKESYSCRLAELRHALDRAEYVVIGAGAGLSAAAGLEYSGRRFTDNFGDFICSYGFTDLYTSSFYPFKTEEERWAYWARHILQNRYDEAGTELYRMLLRTVEQKEWFVITTNVDGLFEKAGFDRKRYLPFRAIMPTCNAPKRAITNYIIMKPSCVRCPGILRIAVSRLRSYPVVPYAAERWR